MQTYQNYEVCIIDDASTQPQQKQIIEHYCNNESWKAIYRNSNQGALANIFTSIRFLSPSDDDVILLLDGDDWLFNKHVFSKIAKEYSESSVLLTYGQFITYPRWQTGFCMPLTKDAIENKNFRDLPFAFSHLRTFRYKVWNAIDEKDFKDSSGCFYRTAWDLAIMYPLLELTGGHGCKFIEDILYVYNMENPLNDCIVHAQLQTETAREIIKKNRYKQKFFEPLHLHQAKRFRRIWNHWISFYKKIITPQVYSLIYKKMIKKFRK